MNKVKNKACPFCGDGVIKAQALMIKNYPAGYNAMCDNCESTGPYAETPEGALEKWNARAGGEPSKTTRKSFAKVNEVALIKAVAADNQVEDVQVLHAMKRHGGGLIKALAEAGFQADSVNLQKLKAAWPDYWAEYAAFARADQQREAEFTAVMNAVERCGCGSASQDTKAVQPRAGQLQVHLQLLRQVPVRVHSRKITYGNTRKTINL